MPLVYIKTLGRTPSLAMWPLGWGRRGSGQIRRGRRRSRSCRGTGTRARSPRARLCSELRQKDTRRRRTVMTGGDGRGGRDFGEGSARAGQQATLGALGSPRGSARVLGDSRNSARLELGGGDFHGGRHGNGGRLGTARARGCDL
jgi:hypothetical protein